MWDFIAEPSAVRGLTHRIRCALVFLGLPRGKTLFYLGQKGITKMEAEGQKNPNLEQGTQLEV